jgi:hypothetical protein
LEAFNGGGGGEGEGKVKTNRFFTFGIRCVG